MTPLVPAPPRSRGLPIERTVHRPGDKVLTSRGWHVEPPREPDRG